MMLWLICLSCRWVQTECKRLGDTDNPEVSELLKMAVRCLKERPVLFKYCAEEVSIREKPPLVAVIHLIRGVN